MEIDRWRAAIADLNTDLAARNRYEIYEHYERYINDGSPSGFGPTTLPEDLQPSSATRRFDLAAFLVADDQRFILGNTDWLAAERIGVDLRSVFPVHPDMAWQFLVQFKNASKHEAPNLTVWATASGRTVVLERNPHVHLKLHYAGVLGRTDRSLPLIKAAAGVEVSKVLTNSAAQPSWPDWLCFLPEPVCIVVLDGEREWGVVVRDAETIHTLDDYVIPLFSVFGHEARNRERVPLAVELLRSHGRIAQERLRQLCLRIQQSYFTLVFEAGLSAELNAQNILVGLDSEGLPTGKLLLRDLMGYEKDLGILPELSQQAPVSIRYKCLQKSTDVKFWQKRHSLAYDHKLMLYCINPLTRLIAQEMNDHSLRDELLDRGMELSRLLPDDYFPQGPRGFRNQGGLLTGKRQYVADVPLLGRSPRADADSM